MEDVRMKFYGCDDFENVTIEVTSELGGRIIIEIDDHDTKKWIIINRATAIQFSKRLKAEISKINQEGKR